MKPKIYNIEDFKHLKQITLKEAKEKNLKLLGSGAGANLGHCLYEGVLHCKDFAKRAKYYAFVSGIQDITENAKDKINSGSMMKVNFYAGEE